MRHRLIAAVLFAGSLPLAARAQHVLGPWDDAWSVPAGVLRYGVAPRFYGASERFGLDGSREQLGASYSGLLTSTTFPAFQSLESTIGDLSGDHAFHVALGATHANFQQTFAVIPFEITAGIASHFAIHASVPFFTGKQEAQWYLNGNGATVGANPELLAPAPLAANASVVAGLSNAASSLEMLADACTADPASNASCTQINAEISAVRALIARTRTTTDQIAQTYGGRDGTAPALFVPLSGTATQSAVANQIAALRALFETYGVTSVLAGASPVGAGAPATITQLNAILSDSIYGYAIGPVKRRYNQGLGDIDVGFSVLAYDGLHPKTGWPADAAPQFALRQSFGFTYRLGTGEAPDPDDPLRLATGDGQNDLEFTSATDLIANRHFWSSLLVRWTKQQALDGIARIPDGTGSPFIPLSRRRNARTMLGDRLAISAAPRWVLNDRLSAGVRWEWTHAQPVTITELAPFADPAPLTYTGQSTSVHEVGIGVSWSSMGAWHHGNSRWPVEIQFDHSIVVAGRGNLTRLSADRISLRAYARLWGK